MNYKINLTGLKRTFGACAILFIASNANAQFVNGGTFLYTTKYAASIGESTFSGFHGLGLYHPNATHIRFKNGTSAYNGFIMGYQTANMFFQNTENNGSFLFQSKGSTSALMDRLSIQPNGNVGIGTASPTANLHVAGNHFKLSPANTHYFDIRSTGFNTYFDVWNNVPAGTTSSLIIGRGPESNIKKVAIVPNLTTNGYFALENPAGGSMKFRHEGYNTYLDVEVLAPVANSAFVIGSTDSGVSNIGRVLINPRLEVKNTIDANTSVTVTGSSYQKVIYGSSDISTNGGTLRLQTETGSGNLVEIGTVSNYSDILVHGKVKSCMVKTLEVQVDDFAGWCDYVFEKDYNLRSIDELATYLDENKHLPGIPSAKEVEEEGLKLADMQKRTMEKVEELHLYVIQLNDEIKKLKEENAKLASSSRNN